MNFVWNYLCEVQRHAEKWRKKWPTAFDLINLTARTSEDLGILSSTVNSVCRQFATSRDRARGCPRWRSNKRSLGWVPFRDEGIKFGSGAVRYRKRDYRIWQSRDIGGQIKMGSFSCDARGRWYVNLTCEVEAGAAEAVGEVGVDLGLKALATCSDGTVIAAPQHYRRHEAALGKAQRAGNKARARAISAKIANCRRDHLHKESTRLVRANRRIVVGNVSASKLAKTKLAKSVMDAGWSSFRFMLAYKAIRHGHEYVEVDEAFSTQACSDCGSIGGPKGIAGLRIRTWECVSCGAVHDRDVNSARVILRFGRERPPLVEEIAA